MAAWTLHLLDSFHLERDGVVVERFGARKEELLLAYLALAPQTPHLRESIVATIWPGKPEALTRRYLSYNLWLLRERLRPLGLPDAIYSGAQTLQLNPAVATDVRLFSQLVVDSVHTQNPDEQASLLERALSLYGEGLLPSYRFAWIEPHRRQLAQVYEDALRRLAEIRQLDMATVALLRHTTPTRSEPGRPTTWPTPPVEPTPPSVESPHFPAVATPEELLDLVEEAEAHLTGPDRTEWLARLDVHYGTLVATLEEAIDRKDRAYGLELASRLWRYWFLRGRVSEGRWFLLQLSLLPSHAPPRTEAAALAAEGILALKAGDVDIAERRLSEALARWQQLDDDLELVRAFANLAMVPYGQGDYERARNLYGQALSVVKRLGYEGEAATPLLNAALCELRLGNVVAARALLGERLDLAERTDNLPLRASTLVHVASTDLLGDDTASAQERATEAISILEPHPDLRVEALAYRVLGRIAHNQGSFEEALTAYNRSLRAAQATGDMWEMGQTMYYQAFTEYGRGHPRKAARLLGQGADFLALGGDAATAEKARSIRLEYLAESRGGPKASPTP